MQNVAPQSAMISETRILPCSEFVTSLKFELMLCCSAVRPPLEVVGSIVAPRLLGGGKAVRVLYSSSRKRS